MGVPPEPAPSHVSSAASLISLKSLHTRRKMDEEYDCIVLGTGLTECILSGMLSVSGKILTRTILKHGRRLIPRLLPRMKCTRNLVWMKTPVILLDMPLPCTETMSTEVSPVGMP